MHDVVIRGATVFTGGKRVVGHDVLLRGGKIAAMGAHLPVEPGADVVEAGGRWLLPGFVDPHVHAFLPYKQTPVRSDYANTSRSGLLGGTTCMMDFVGSGNEKSIPEALAIWQAQADGKSFCDYAWHMTVTHYDAAVEKDLLACVEKGVRSIKIYLAYKPNLAISDDALFRVMTFAAAHDLVVMGHCENADWIPLLQQRLLAEGKTGPEWHPASRPPMVEADGVYRFLACAELTGARAYVVHLTCKEALAVADSFRGRVKDLRVETMMHYLLLDESWLARPDFEGAKWILSPPLRTKADQAVLWEALADGRVDTLGSDHCPFDFHGQKELGRGDFTKIPNGIGGIGERLPLAFTYGVCAGHLTMERLIEVGAENPAKIFGLWPRKGCIAEGSDADLVLWNPDVESVIVRDSYGNGTDYHPFDGMAVKGRADWVWSDGRAMVRDGVWQGDDGMGEGRRL